MNPYLSLLIMFAVAMFIAIAGLATSAIIGPYRPNKSKVANYECGIDPTPGLGAVARFPVKYYLVAMMFIIFDIEVIFLYPWAVSFTELGASGFFVMLAFMEILTAPFIYVWARGGFDWN